MKPASRFVSMSIVVLALAAPFQASRAQTMKPGLWEHTSSTRSQSGEMERAMAEAQKQMAAMSPEQRRQMEQAMGMQLSAGPGGRNTVRICITPEDATKFDIQSDPNCRQQVTQRGGGTVRIKFSCSGEMPSEGEGTMTFKGDNAFSGKFMMQVRADGKTDRMEITQEAKWLGNDCGALKPVRRK